MFRRTNRYSAPRVIAHLVLWIYIALLVTGGLIGFLKAKSRASLITSAIFAGLIALSALGVLALWVAMLWIGLLVVFFGMRFSKGKKFMPAGLMTIAGAVALVLLLILNR